MVHAFKYGHGYLSYELPSDHNVINSSPPPGYPDKESFSDQLSRLLKKDIKSAGIIVSDKTRLCGYDMYLPWLLDELHNKGIKKENIRFYIAYGTHPAQNTGESLKAYGNIFREYEFIHHNCDDLSSLVTLGKTMNNTPVSIRKDIFEHDQLILFGSVSHHYFAGYGGGRKLIFPGLAGREAIYSNHKLFIDFENRCLKKGCASGRLKGNPVAEDLREADRFTPDKIIISALLNPDGEVSKFTFSSSYDEFLETCNIYDEHYRVCEKSNYDNVIASAGGYPKDINFIQTHKSVHNAASFVKDGGNLLILSECNDGIGKEEFLDIFKGDKDEIYASLQKHYSGNGGTALSLLSKTERINISMVTSLNHNTCRQLGIRKLTKSEAPGFIEGMKGNTAIIENASIVYK